MAIYCYVNGKMLYQQRTRELIYWVWMHGSIHMTRVLECMTRVDEMNFGVSISMNKIFMGEKCYIMLIHER